jgi:hypothetical protein
MSRLLATIDPFVVVELWKSPRELLSVAVHPLAPATTT